MRKIHFRPGFRPGSRWGSLRRSPEPLVGWRGDTSPHVSSLSISRHTEWGRVIGPRDNVFPGPAVALDGPAWSYSLKQRRIIPQNSYPADVLVPCRPNLLRFAADRAPTIRFSMCEGSAHVLSVCLSVRLSVVLSVELADKQYAHKREHIDGDSKK